MRTKDLIILLLILGINSTAFSQTNGVAFGASAGASAWIANGDLINKTGISAGLEIDYLGRNTLSKNTELGAKVGISVGFASAYHQLVNYSEQYSNQDYYPEWLDYTITADTYKQLQQQWQLTIPIMLALKTHGVVLNAGAKAMCLISQKRTLDVNNAHINVYYRDFDVPTTDYLATGRLTEFKQHQSNNSNMPTLSILLTAELGYEWTLTNVSIIGVCAYADYNVWNNYNNKPPQQRLIDVAPIINKEYPVPDIKVNYLTDTYANKVNYLSLGVKIYYLLAPNTTKHKSSRAYPCRCVPD